MKRLISMLVPLLAPALFAVPLVELAPATQNPEEPKVRQPLPSPEEIAKLPADGGAEFNRLVFESSPYLIQHARNPVDWYPWGEEAFAAAKAQDKPIFLSIGYSTCHWCHVMEHESFEDAEVAKLMNDAFVCIKVDREERPDVDHVYMTFAQAYGRGGWPMTILMTGDKKPFLAGTYFPKSQRGGRAGMMELIPSVKRLWTNERDTLIREADKLLNFVQGQNQGGDASDLDPGVMRRARLALNSSFDAVHGGFGGAPKFPVPHNLRFLLREHAASGDIKSRDNVMFTLQKMRLGGIWDHVGFGFHRYSTDSEWLLPHFEKMLYDQALLAMAYTEGWQISKDPQLAQTVEQIFTYVLRDMRDSKGGFYSAEDADSEGEEGLFYIWTEAELEKVIGAEDAKFFADLYGFEEQGNFRDEASGSSSGHNIPHLETSLADQAAAMGDQGPEFLARVERIRKTIFDFRETRIHPLKDDKILTDWNGLMIAAMAKAGGAMQRPEWIEAARQAAEFAVTHLRNAETGRLYKRSRGGESGLPGLLEDYAFLTWGLIELHQVTQDPRWLEIALALTDQAQTLFWDTEHGGFLMTPAGGEELLIPAKEVYDGAIPSGNSVMLSNLCRLARLTGRSQYEERATELTRAFAVQIQKGPQAYTQFLMGFGFQMGPTQEIVIAGDPSDALTQAMWREALVPFLPMTVFAHRPLGAEPAIAKWAPFVKDQIATDGKPTAYVCTNFACQAPVYSAEALRAMLTPQKESPAQKPAQDSAETPAEEPPK